MGWRARNTEEVASMPDWYCTKHQSGYIIHIGMTSMSQRGAKYFDDIKRIDLLSLK